MVKVVRFFQMMTALAASIASADVLTFTGTKCSNNNDGSGPLVTCLPGSAINQAYGDSSSVNVSYAATNSLGSVSMQAWPSGFGNGTYSNLPDAAYGFFGADSISVTLVPLAGGTVTLNSLNIGSTVNIPRTATLQVTDLLTNATVFTVTLAGANQVGATAALVSPGVSSAAGLRLALVNTDVFNVGLSNINFTVAPAAASGVPEPQTVGLTAVGVLGLGLARWRRSRRDSSSVQV